MVAIPEVHSEETAKPAAPQGHASNVEKATVKSPSHSPVHTMGTSPVAVPASNHHNTTPIPTTKAEPPSRLPHNPTRLTSGPPTATEHNGSHTFAHGGFPPASHGHPTAKPSPTNPETLKSPTTTSPETQTTAPPEHPGSPEKHTTATLPTTHPGDSPATTQATTTTPRFVTSRTTLSHSTETQSPTETKDGSTTTTHTKTTANEAPTSTKKGHAFNPCSVPVVNNFPVVNHVLCPQTTTATTLKTSITQTSGPGTTDRNTTPPDHKASPTQTHTVKKQTTTSKTSIQATPNPPLKTTQTKETNPATTDTHRHPGPTATNSTTDHTTTFTHQTGKPTNSPVHDTHTTVEHTTEPSKVASTTATNHAVIRTGHPTNKPEQPATTTPATTKAAPTNTKQRMTTVVRIASTPHATGQHSTTQGHGPGSSAPADTMTATVSGVAVNPASGVCIFLSMTSCASGTIGTTGSASTMPTRVAKPTANKVFQDDNDPVSPTSPSPSANSTTAATLQEGDSASSIPTTSPHRGPMGSPPPTWTPRQHNSENGRLPASDIIAISVSAAVVCLAAIGALLVFFLCRRRRRKMPKTFDPGHSTSPSHGSITYLPVYSTVPISDYQNTTHSLPVLPKTEATPRHDPRALSVYAYTAQVEKAPADAMTSYNAVYNASNDQASARAHSKSVSTIGTLYETVPIQSHAPSDYLREPQDPKRVTSLTGSIASNVNYGVAL
ncbi:hypothetical protein D9619_002688 [Psilocybe cf. subviscida]|uniref:Uncharacterized protein n=1 Tax=Psilocybe cf. subviscida TaxID=2480587 RepID=A0A8H5AXD0_9AGAR|nr:hypothetical protein D9619_002688 [Psilocybe cf. subviscida]